eukprot:gene17339-20774_t
MKYNTFLSAGQYSGAISRMRHLEGVIAGITSYQKGSFNPEFHYHENPVLSFVLQGGNLENRKSLYKERNVGDMMFFHSGEWHRTLPAEKLSRNINLELENSFLKRYDIQEKDLNNSSHCNTGNSLQFLKMYKELCMDDEFSTASVQMLLFSMIAEVKKTDQLKKPEWVKKITEILRDQWNQTQSLENLSLLLQIHPITISKHFSHYFGCTLGAYLRKIRIEKSITLVRDRQITLTEIAFHCGFSDQSHFIRNFKSLTGLLPGEFRRQNTIRTNQQKTPMNKIKVSCLFLFSLTLLTGCSKNQSYSQETYKGGQKHQQPDAGIFPVSDNYKTTSFSGGLKDSLDKAIRDLYHLTGMPGISAALLIPDKGLWHTDTGFISRPAQKKVDQFTVFYWASVGKLLTATIIEQLIGEQKLQHESKLSNWFPEFQYAEQITIDELLMHTSGIYSFNNDPKTFLVEQYYSPQQLIVLSRSQKNLFKPGMYWSYSNTGYLLLALIAQKIEGKSFAQIVQQRIASPLKLKTLRVLEPGESTVHLALAHKDNRVINEDYAVPLGAGNIVSNAQDMVMFLYSLMTGSVAKTPQVYDRLRDLYPMFDKGSYYGRGIMLTDFNELTNNNTLWIGHSGGTETYRALLIYDTATRIFAA